MEKVRVSTPSSIEVMEEAANALTHGLGFILSVYGFIWLVSTSMATADPWRIGSSILFGLSLIALYGASMLYHTFQTPKLKRLWRTIDHCAIYTLIAGSYTPFTLVTLDGFWGWTLFISVWFLAVIGIAYKIIFSPRDKDVLSTLFYLGMGWLVVMAIGPLMESLHPDGVKLLVAGGIFYTVGALVYIVEKPRFHHAIWHLFVLAGSACHYFSVLYYVLPR